MPKQDYLGVLRQYLEPKAWATLCDLLAQRKQPPFEYDVQAGRLEPALDDIDPDAMDAASMDVVLTACDILNQHAELLDLQSVQSTVEPDTGVLEHSFAFTKDDPQYPIFAKLLEPMAETDDFSLEIVKLADSVQLIVKLRYCGEHDYQQKKDQLFFLRDLARRRVKEAPFQGNRL